MPLILSEDEERERRKRLPSPVPPLPRRNRLDDVRQRMAVTPTGTPAYNALAREAEELERQAGAGFLRPPGLRSDVLPLVEKYQRGVIEPLAGAAIMVGPVPLPGRDDMARKLLQGQGLGEAYRTTDMPSLALPESAAARVKGVPYIGPFLPTSLGQKGALEMGVDPTNILPGPPLGKLAKAGAKGVEAGTRAVGREIVREVTPGPSGLVPGSPGFAKVPKGGKAPAGFVPDEGLLDRFEEAVRARDAAFQKFGFESKEANAAREVVRQAKANLEQAGKPAPAPPATAAKVAKPPSPVVAPAAGPRSGYTRFYRGVLGPKEGVKPGEGFGVLGPDFQRQYRGLWFSSDKLAASRYGSVVTFVDVPNEQIPSLREAMLKEKGMAHIGTDEPDTLLLSRELAQQEMPVPEAAPRGAPPVEPPKPPVAQAASSLGEPGGGPPTPPPGQAVSPSAPPSQGPTVPLAPPSPPAQAGKYWLPEPPRITPEYMAAARKGQGAVFRGKEGAFDIIEQARQLVLKARDVGQNAIPRVASHIRVVGDTVSVFGVDKNGLATRVVNPEGRSLAINDVLSNYTHYQLSPKQLEIAKRQGFIYQEALKLARSYGVEIKELGGPDEFWQYIARRVKSKLNPLTGEYETPPGVIGGFKLGAQISAQKERVFEEMAEGLNLGLLYENPDQVLAAHIQGIYRLIGNKQAEALIKPLTREITEKAPLVFGERAVYEPALRGRAAAVEIANAIDKVFTPEQEIKALRIAADISGAMVGQVASLDVSAPFIQGLPLLGHDIKQALKGKQSGVWLAAYGRMWKSVQDPTTIHRFRSANPDLYKRFIEAGGMTGQSEFVGGVPLTERWLGKIPVVGKPLREVYKQTWGRFGQAFSDFLEIAKVKFFEQMEPVWQRNGDNLFELGAVTNRMAGGVSSAARGVGVNQRLLERSLAFAPNYLRSSMLLMRDMMSRGATAREVQASLAAFLGAGAAMYYAEEKVRGREPKMKPWPKRLGGDGADAFTTQIGNTRVGLGSWTYGMIKLLAEVGAVAVDEPESLVVWNERHPLVRWLKTKQGPAIALARELATGRNFWGKKFDGADDYLMRIAESFVPIAGQSTILERGEPAQAAADVMGFRAYPYTLTSQWRDSDDYKLYAKLPGTVQEAKAKKTRTRAAYRKANPELNAKLYIAGEVESVETGRARALVVKLIRENKVNPKEVPGLQPKEFESDERKELRLWILRAMGQPGIPAVAPSYQNLTPSPFNFR